MWEDEPAKKHAWNRLDHGSRTCKDVWGKDNRGKFQLDDFSSGLNALALALESFWGGGCRVRKSVCAMFRNLEFTSGSVACDSGFVRMCFENVFQCHVLHDIRISVLHVDCIGQWGSRLCACAIRMLFVLQVVKQLFCGIVIEIVGQRWPRGATLTASPP